LNLRHPIAPLLLLRHLEGHARFAKRPHLSGPATDFPNVKGSKIERMDLCEGVADEIGGLSPLAPHAREKSEQCIGRDLFEVEAQRTGTTRQVSHQARKSFLMILFEGAIKLSIVRFGEPRIQHLVKPSNRPGHR
jgi:hypothetical protein